MCEVNKNESLMSHSAFWVFVDNFGILFLTLACIFCVGNSVYILVRWQHWKVHFKDRFTRRDPRSPTFTGARPPQLANHPKKLSSRQDTDLNGENKTHASATVLNMDNVKVSFSDFLWVSYIIVPNAVLLWIIAIGKLLFKRREKQWMYSDGQQRGIRVEFSHERLVAKMVLESSEVVRYEGKIAVEENGNTEHAFFRWRNLIFLDKENEVTRAKEMIVVIALPEKAMVSATLDDTELSAKQATILIAFDNWALLHPKIHAFANWGVNVENYQNPYLRRASTITVMYNHFGFHSFPIIASWFYLCGLARQKWSNLTPVWEETINEEIPHFKRGLKEIKRFSKTCRFLLRLRKPFFAEFQKHKTSFPFIDKDSLFLGTVMHSIDHCNASWNIEDHNWFDVSDERFGNLAELCQFVLLGAVDDVPLVVWPKHFHNCAHPFYKKVFEIAHEIDPKLALHMDTAIIK